MQAQELAAPLVSLPNMEAGVVRLVRLVPIPHTLEVPYSEQARVVLGVLAVPPEDKAGLGVHILLVGQEMLEVVRRLGLLVQVEPTVAVMAAAVVVLVNLALLEAQGAQGELLAAEAVAAERMEMAEIQVLA